MGDTDRIKFRLTTIRGFIVLQILAVKTKQGV